MRLGRAAHQPERRRSSRHALRACRRHRARHDRAGARRGLFRRRTRRSCCKARSLRRQQASRSVPGIGGGAQLREFVSCVLADTEDAWSAIFTAGGRDLRAADAGAVLGRRAVGLRLRPGRGRAVLLSRATARSTSTCRSSTSCSSRFGAPGDFAQAYVIAHEVGHHVQNLLGISERTHGGAPARRARRRRTRFRCGRSCRPTASPASGRTTPTPRQVLEAGDVEEGLSAAAAIGDDRLQKQAQRPRRRRSRSRTAAREQRVRWFKRGFETGRSSRAIRSRRETCKLHRHPHSPFFPCAKLPAQERGGTVPELRSKVTRLLERVTTYSRLLALARN